MSKSEEFIYWKEYSLIKISQINDLSYFIL